MQDIQGLLAEAAGKYEIALTPGQLAQFQAYADLLVEWNEKMNLTAIKDPEGIVLKHFLDSVLILKDLNPPKGASLVDVGTGAGFPGVPLLILRPDLKLTLLDSLQKRLTFLTALLEKLSLKAELVHARAEEAGQKPEFRLRYDFATARAVASLNVLCEYCLPLLRQGGVFAAMKGPSGPEELDAAKKAIQLLGCKTKECKSYGLPGRGGLPDGDARTLVLIRRTGLLPAEYPRPAAKIAKAPL